MSPPYAPFYYKILLRVFSDIINFGVFWVKSYFGQSRIHCHYIVDCRVPAKNLCGKIATTPVQNRRPDWNSRGVRSRIGVTALTLPRFPMRGREPFQTRFCPGIEIRGFNQIKTFLGQITPQKNPIILVKKEKVLCALFKGKFKFKEKYIFLLITDVTIKTT